MKPEKFIGIDLTDGHAGNPRPVDVAILDAKTGGVRFETFAWPPIGANWGTSVTQEIRKFRGSDETVYVLDGPQALAEPQRNVRRVEEHLRTPGRTPWELPVSRTRPFAGYLRSSVELYEVLTNNGFRLAELDGEGADLYEAYPGAAWPLLYCGADSFQSKSTPAGRQQRSQILEAMGCRLPQRRLSHDELDAALCAALGWRFYYPHDGGNVELAPPPTPCVAPGLAVFRDQGGTLREGRILMPLRNKSGVAERSPETPAVSGTPPPQRGGHGGEALPECTWVYIASDDAANPYLTYEFAADDGVICRNVHNHGTPDGRPRVANVANVLPLDTILLAFRDRGRCRPLGRFQVMPPAEPVGPNIAPAISSITDPKLTAALASFYEEPDPQLNVLTGFNVDLREDLQQSGVRFDAPHNTIQRYGDLFDPNGRARGRGPTPPELL